MLSRPLPNRILCMPMRRQRRALRCSRAPQAFFAKQAFFFVASLICFAVCKKYETKSPEALEFSLRTSGRHFIIMKDRGSTRVLPQKQHSAHYEHNARRITAPNRRLLNALGERYTHFQDPRAFFSRRKRSLLQVCKRKCEISLHRIDLLF